LKSLTRTLPAHFTNSNARDGASRKNVVVSLVFRKGYWTGGAREALIETNGKECGSPSLVARCIEITTRISMKSQIGTRMANVEADVLGVSAASSNTARQTIATSLRP